MGDGTKAHGTEAHGTEEHDGIEERKPFGCGEEGLFWGSFVVLSLCLLAVE